MDDATTTLAEFAILWLGHLVGTVARGTLASYGTVVRGYIVPSALGTMMPGDIRAQHVRDFLVMQRRAGWSAGFVRLMQTVLAGILHDAVEREVIAVNPAAALWRRVPRELRVIFDPNATTPPDGTSTAILGHLREGHVPLARVVAVYLATGCRRSEALGLQVDDLDFAHQVLTIGRQWYGARRHGLPKGRRPRTIDMSQSLETVLHEAVAESARMATALGCDPMPRWLFRSPYTGLPWNPGHVTRVVRAAAVEVTGRRFGPKSFRHAVATNLMTRNGNPRYVQLLLGHSSLTTTMKYVAHRGIRDRKAVDSLDNL